MATTLSNGASTDAAGSEILTRIRKALEIVHSPYSPNESRQEAQSYLEHVKTLAEAPSFGNTLASEKTQGPVVRHYGLSLLEHAVKHRWAEYSESQRGYLRGWILQLAEGVSKDDPSYLRSKTAQLWVEIAKRCWVDTWMDMDELLLRLWQAPDSPAHKELVLQILEILSDEIFSGEDTVVALRESVLSKACVEIFTPSAVLQTAFPNRQIGPHVRCGDEGWMNRVALFLGECLGGGVEQNEHVKACTIRALAVLNSAMSWAIPKAIHAAGIRPTCCSCLAVPSVSVQRAALEVLHTLFSRPIFSPEEFVQLIVPMYDDDLVDLFRRLFEWSAVDAQDIDDEKYQFSKKFSEMISCIGTYMDKRYSAIPPHTNIQRFLELLILVTQSQSLVVSIPVLVTWTRLLANKPLRTAAITPPIFAALLELCSSRLIRYESLPEDTEDPTYVLLIEDTDTIPERHAFLGNYRRYSTMIIEEIVSYTLAESLTHILGQAENVLQTLYDGQPPLDPSKYSKTSPPILRVDAHATVIEAALKGFIRWKINSSKGEEQTMANIEGHLEAWCGRVLEMKFEDPLIRKRILQLLVAFSTMALDANAGFMLRVLEYILMTWPALQPEHKLFNDAIRDLQTESMVELQRLASKMPDHLLDVYDQLEAKVKEMIASGTLDEKRQIAYQSFLFIILHRTSRIDPTTRLARLTTFIEPVKDRWKDPSLKQALESFDGFTQLMGLDKAQRYLAKHRINEVGDWGSVELDAEGLELQRELEQRQTLLPLRMTKSFLTYSVEKLDKGSTPYLASCALWQDGFPLILPELLKFLSYAHACHDPKNWSLLPQEIRALVGRVLTDRFWQAGISEGSKDEFYARVLEKKNTLEGLASSIRGTVRFVRETCYAIIYCMSRLDVQFYGFTELPGPLANALFADSFSLSAHQVISLLNLVRYLVDNCPIELRTHFLPPILATCFQQMDTKITSEWDQLGQQGQVQAAAEELTEEMKAESILRQLSYTAVLMVADFLDPSKLGTSIKAHSNEESDNLSLNGGDGHPSLRKFCLMNSSIVVPLLLFCSHAIQIHDGRCCSTVLRVFRSIIPEFQGTTANARRQAPDAVAGAQDDFPISEDTAREIREFISTEVLKAAISSLHEPYFVDLHKDLAQVIGNILMFYARLTPTPREILLSLPNMKPQDIDRAIDYLSHSPVLHSRQIRAAVLDLLKDVKGVSISEMGKLNKSLGIRPDSSRSGKKPHRSKMAQEFMTAEGATSTGASVDRKTPDLEGVAGMFKESA